MAYAAIRGKPSMTKGYYFNYLDIFHITPSGEGLGRGKRDRGVKSSETEQPDQSQILWLSIRFGM